MMSKPLNNVVVFVVVSCLSRGPNFVPEYRLRPFQRSNFDGVSDGGPYIKGMCDLLLSARFFNSRPYENERCK